MKRLLFLVIIIFHSFQFTFGQQLEDFNVDFMVRGYIYAGSAIEDTLSPGGFGKSNNMPKELDSYNSFKENGFFLKIDTTAKSAFAGKYHGYKLYIVNKTDSIIQLRAEDSRLNVIAEAYINNQWQPIEYLPRSFCGNSYHYVYLKSGQYWEFPVPQYKGKIKTKLRYKLTINKNVQFY